mmetsp:Transcript_31870/g.82498  ORF Transcript_31870/g.82498 Transcript_31870/m.82498 type:complete len:217 (+) Transcript_31870:1160-1810(+)
MASTHSRSRQLTEPATRSSRRRCGWSSTGWHQLPAPPGDPPATARPPYLPELCSSWPRRTRASVRAGWLLWSAACVCSRCEAAKLAKACGQDPGKWTASGSFLRRCTVTREHRRRFKLASGRPAARLCSTRGCALGATPFPCAPQTRRATPARPPRSTSSPSTPLCLFHMEMTTLIPGATRARSPRPQNREIPEKRKTNPPLSTDSLRPRHPRSRP